MSNEPESESRSLQFKTGDVVILKSGGTPMTIRATMHPETAICEWSNGTEIKTHEFDFRMIIPFRALSERQPIVPPRRLY